MGCLFAAVVISVTKEGVKFSTRGDIGTANVVCRQNTTVDKVQSFVCLVFCRFVCSNDYFSCFRLSGFSCFMYNKISFIYSQKSWFFDLSLVLHTNFISSKCVMIFISFLVY